MFVSNWEQNINVDNIISE